MEAAGAAYGWVPFEFAGVPFGTGGGGAVGMVGAAPPS
ncbi:hypothetical protein STVIR_4482 [Streptomyces viridochromogenes Tue57]|uniref:Uncharacterized protein n=1 Tax=Streptomyces viridochromogenes Tue57 TaxID=1160705 RepID=L8PAG0_STRVR|nr:hypothetical protein STVIR_4482 [Streptomyces viridochromogenes Tue57]